MSLSVQMPPGPMHALPAAIPLLRSFTAVLFEVREIIYRHRKIADGQFKTI